MSTRFIQGYCSHALIWEAANYTLAPYLVEFDEAALRDVSKTLLHTLHALRVEESSSAIKLGLAWDTPPELHGVEAIGPNGAYTGKGYEAYIDTAQDFALVFMQVYTQWTASTELLPIPVVTIPVEVELTATAFHEIIQLTLNNGLPIELRNDQTSLLLPFQEETLQARSMVAQCLTINMPRLVYALNKGGNFWAQLDRVIDMAASAFAEKHCFLKSLVARKQNGPYSLFAMNHNGVAFADIDSAVYELNVCGLNECIALLKDSVPEEGNTSDADWRRAILNHLTKRCAEWMQHSGLMLRLNGLHNSVLATQLVSQDLKSDYDLVKPVLAEGHLAYSMTLSASKAGDEVLCEIIDQEWTGFRGAGLDIALNEDASVSLETIRACLQKHPELSLNFYPENQ